VNNKRSLASFKPGRDGRETLVVWEIRSWMSMEW
jgi:hypothetical protein